MQENRYSYEFDLSDGMVTKEENGPHQVSPIFALGLRLPIAFEDYVDVWKTRYEPVFNNAEDEKKLTRKYLEDAYNSGERLVTLEFEHKSLKILKSSNYSRLIINLYEDEETKNPRARVEWEKIPNEVWKETH